MHGINERIRSGEIGYWVRTSQAGKGIATAATALIMRFGFAELKLHRILLRAAIDNPASWRVAEKLGFVYDGIQRHEQLFERGWVDLKCYSMLEDEYRNLKPHINKLADGKKD
jgi:RimJ/RimL family protein N-acetyltransferase